MSTSKPDLSRFFSMVALDVLAAAILTCGSATSSMGGEVRIELEQMKVGQPPAGFSFGRTGQGGVGAWAIVADPTAKAGLAIEQISTDATDNRFPLAILDGFSGKNLRVEVRFKAMSGKVDRAGGIAFRVADPSNYYIVRANALENNVRFYRVVAGKREQLGTADVHVTSGEWHTLSLTARDQTFAVTYDGYSLFEVSDPTITKAGAVGLWTKADSVTRFDSITMTPTP